MTPAHVTEWVVLGYFLGLHVTYLALNGLAYRSILKSSLRRLGATAPVDPSLLPPITVVVPAHGEEAVIVASVESLLQLTYPAYEVVVVNDGSRDETFAALADRFGLEPYAEAYRERIETAPIRGFYRAPSAPQLRVIDKEQGGRADAVNAGVNAARSPLFCTIDADSILARDSLQRVVRPFLEDRSVVASGGTVRIANGCVIRHGFLERVGLPTRPLVLFQVIEYLRAFLFGRVGWASFNGLLVLSGAFGLFHKETVVAAGGLRTDTLGEDMELVVRLHRVMRQAHRPYRVAYVPDPICFTEAPGNLRQLGRQRVRWQRGLGESLTMNTGLAFRGPVGWFSYLFHLIFELFGPFVEVAGYTLAISAWAAGVLTTTEVLAFAFAAIGLGLAFSTSTLILEELSFQVYPRTRDLAVLTAAAVGENFGYRQVNAWWRLVGLVRFLGRAPRSWGLMERVGVTTHGGEHPSRPGS